MSLDFDTINRTTSHINDNYYSYLQEAYNFLASGDAISTSEKPTPDEILKKLEKIRLDSETKMEELKANALAMKGIYESVIK